MITIDTDSVVQNVNPAVSAVFGYEPEELIGQPMTALIPERYEPATPPHQSRPQYRRAGARLGERFPAAAPTGRKAPSVSPSANTSPGRAVLHRYIGTSASEGLRARSNHSSGRSRRRPTAWRFWRTASTSTSTRPTSTCTASTKKTSCSASRGGNCTTTRRRPASKRRPSRRSKPTATSGNGDWSRPDESTFPAEHATVTTFPARPVRTRRSATLGRELA
ncbi:hypothetical protein C8039_19435 [Halogeometricum sp. wsp3]|nr:hypothetical protein C8039_19435 [Halogeometricum sp. wsp3]